MISNWDISKYGIDLKHKYKDHSNSLEKGLLNYTIGENYYQNGDLIKATLYFKKAVSILEFHKKTNLELLNKVRLYLAGIYYYEEKENDCDFIKCLLSY